MVASHSDARFSLRKNGTTDYAGALLKLHAAEGLLQGHHVHVIGMPEQWGRELPGATGEIDKRESVKRDGRQDEDRLEVRGFGTA